MSNQPEDASAWSCTACGKPLEIIKVAFSYMKGNFELPLPACPACGLVMISEDLATGKMAEAERILEDK
jgi:predicted RNA-binding Zn-ribbon protein involved in translation (DUF1610 family)